MAFRTPKMDPKMAPETPGMARSSPKMALPQTDKPNLEGAAVIPEGIVNPPQGFALSRRGAAPESLQQVIQYS